MLRRCNHSDRLCVVRLGKERDWFFTPYVGVAENSSEAVTMPRWRHRNLVLSGTDLGAGCEGVWT
jgi:hypothetical protein